MSERVFCKDCKHLSRIHRHLTGELGIHQWTEQGKHCGASSDIVYDPINGARAVYRLAAVVNANMNCRLFERPEPRKRPPWWHIWEWNIP